MVKQLVPEDGLLGSEQGLQTLYLHFEALMSWEEVCCSHSSAYPNPYASQMILSKGLCLACPEILVNVF